MNLPERLGASRGKLISAAGTIPFQQLATEALETAQQFPSGSRILLWSDDVRQIIVILAAAEHAGANVFIAHRTIARPEIDSMLQRFAVTHLVQPGAIEPVRAQPGEPSRFVYVMTSGTTRAPKVARHTLNSLFGTIQSTHSSRHSRWLLTFPPTAFAGLQVIFSAVLGGGDLVLPPERTMDAFAETAARQAVTHISGTPTFWRSFLLVLGDRELSLHQITVGGEAVDQATLDRLKQRFPSARITHIYASTEAGVGFSVHDCRAGIPAAWISSGVSDVQLRVNDGVLEIKSPRALKRYESGEATPLDSEGWLSSGDLVRLEEDRYLFVGRTDRRLNVGGFKITPEEVEAVLMGCDAVADVQVSGLASPISGQVLCATVVPRHAAERDQVKKAVQQFAYQRLEPFKVPRVIRVVEALQASDSGKKARQ